MANPFQVEIKTISERAMAIQQLRVNVQNGQAQIDPVQLLFWLQQTNDGLARLLGTVGELTTKVANLQADPMADHLQRKR